MLSGYRYIDCLEDLAVRDLMDPEICFEQEQALAALRRLVDILRQSPTAAFLVDEAAAYDFKFVIDEQLSFDESGFQKKNARLIFPSVRMKDLKCGKTVGRLLLMLAGAFRRALKTNQGYQERFDLVPADYLRLTRLVEADIDAVSVQVCWELRAAGHPSAWRQLLAGEKGDLAVVYTQALKNHPVGQFDGKALRQVFRHWFADQARTNGADHMALEFLDMVVALPGQYEMTTDGRIGENDFRKIQKNLPFKTYLEGMNLGGKWFDGLKDAYNQVHLQHIMQDLMQARKNF